MTISIYDRITYYVVGSIKIVLILILKTIKSFILVSCLLFFGFSFGQEKPKKIVLKFSAVSFCKEGKWEDKQKSHNTFVFNTTSNGDILHYKPDGDKEYFRRIDKITEEETDDGEKYHSVKMLDERGDEVLFVLFENGLLVLFFGKDFQIVFIP